MKNKIEKNNLTKFDYTARKLGIVGICLITLSIAFGGALINNLNKQNVVLMNALATEVESEEKQKSIEDEIGKEQHIYII